MIILFRDSWLSSEIVENSDFVCLRTLLKFNISYLFCCISADNFVLRNCIYHGLFGKVAFKHLWPNFNLIFLQLENENSDSLYIYRQAYIPYKKRTFCFYCYINL